MDEHDKKRPDDDPGLIDVRPKKLGVAQDDDPGPIPVRRQPEVEEQPDTGAA
jgi:hypothetical protein